MRVSTAYEHHHGAQAYAFNFPSDSDTLLNAAHGTDSGIMGYNYPLSASAGTSTASRPKPRNELRLMISNRSLLMVVVMAVPALTGSQCVFVASSGDNHACVSTVDKPCNQQNNTDPVVVVTVDNGQLIDAPVQGVRYESGSVSGVTGYSGGFQYETGGSVRFYIGDIALGEAVRGKSVITPLDLVPNGTIDTPAVINIARLLQSLDSIPGDNRITIPALLRAEAVRSNVAVDSSIQYMDFSDETAFVNAATQLISTLTVSYPFTAVLVDKQSAREHLTRTLDAAGISTGN